MPSRISKPARTARSFELHGDYRGELLQAYFGEVSEKLVSRSPMLTVKIPPHINAPNDISDRRYILRKLIVRNNW